MVGGGAVDVGVVGWTADEPDPQAARPTATTRPTPRVAKGVPSRRLLRTHRLLIDSTSSPLHPCLRYCHDAGASLWRVAAVYRGAVVDLIVIVTVVVAAIQGFRIGAVVLVFTIFGFFCGLYVGALVASTTVTWVHAPTAKTAVALTTMMGIAFSLGMIGRVIGDRVYRRVHRGVVGSVDSGFGLAVAAVAGLLTVWLLASTFVNSSSTALNAAIASSRILRSVGEVLPPPPSVFARAQGFLTAQGFPPVFAQLAPASAGPVNLPTDSAIRAAVEADGASTVKIVGIGCGHIQEGSGFVVARGVVVTNAHVVAGIARPSVEDQAGAHDTTVVSYDPSYDLAVLRVAGLPEPPLPLVPTMVDRGVQGAVLGYPEGGPFTARPAGVKTTFEAEGRDIYGQGLTVRRVYQIQATVLPGNSGGPLVLTDGRVIGVVFSRSTTDNNVGYALVSPDVLSRVLAVKASARAVGTGACAPG